MRHKALYLYNSPKCMIPSINTDYKTSFTFSICNGKTAQTPIGISIAEATPTTTFTLLLKEIRYTRVKKFFFCFLVRRVVFSYCNAVGFKNNFFKTYYSFFSGKRVKPLVVKCSAVPVLIGLRVVLLSSIHFWFSPVKLPAICVNLR